MARTTCWKSSYEIKRIPESKDRTCVQYRSLHCSGLDSSDTRLHTRRQNVPDQSSHKPSTKSSTLISLSSRGAGGGGLGDVTHNAHGHQCWLMSLNIPPRPSDATFQTVLYEDNTKTHVSMLYVTDHSANDTWVETFLHTRLVHVSKSESFSAYATFLYTRKHACKAPHIHKHVFSIPNVHLGFIPTDVWHAGTEPPAFHLAGELLYFTFRGNWRTWWSCCKTEACTIIIFNNLYLLNCPIMMIYSILKCHTPHNAQN